MRNHISLLLYIGLLIGLVLLVQFMPINEAAIEHAPPPQLPTATPTLIARPSPTPTLSQTCRPTPGGTQYGYQPDAPFTTTLAPPDLPAIPLRVSGTVYATDCQTPLPDVLLEVWHADLAGKYDPARSYPFRGQMQTDAAGQYQYRTVKPGRYVTGTEPLPSNIHYRVSYQGEILFTQLFFANDPFLHRFPFTFDELTKPVYQQTTANGPMWQVYFNLVLPIEPP